jgi:hypothetical protein
MRERRPTQADRLLAYLRRRGRDGVTSMDVIDELGIVNVTGRVSDLRAKGYQVKCRRERGLFVFFLDVPPPVAQLGLDGSERALL